MLTNGLMIAAPRSGSGKTTLTLGLLRALKRRGVAIAAAKSGPDYIDPAFHAAATGRPSYNLDSWAMAPDILANQAALAADGAQTWLVEASMGLFDGVPATLGRSGASADIAAAFGLPVVLVLDISGQAQSAAAIVKGCCVYDPRVKIAGVVLNQVASPRHLRLASAAIEAMGVPVLGAMPRSQSIRLPERHLGLVQAGETPELGARLDAMADFVEQNVNIAALMACAAPLAAKVSAGTIAHALPPPDQTIAIARDDAFSFIYPHLVAGWRAQGAQILWFSPLADEAPPAAADICWLPGGYPELHAARLSAATHFRTGLQHFATTRPVHGECGGYMVLGAALIDAQNIAHPMTGLLGHTSSFAVRKMQLGYRAASLMADGALGPAGTRLTGHEFHYASVSDPGHDEAFALVHDAYDPAPKPAGSRRGHVTGSFFHVISSAR
ncbi:MAG: cobyrinate a,c-diamide synthase [Hyphomicrobiales bacterium]|nr:cobyrinate a,c-diamide synthase [Hyphomicrobiales bacterium]MDE2114710.1 cobyrinate a,c-diamide synthase [Hyphomicrobiales bacterium]